MDTMAEKRILDNDAATAKTRREVRVRGVSAKTLDELKNIAACSGVTLGQLLRPKFAEIVAQYPEHMRRTAPER